ncbi:MAG: hypothetical protein LQ351_007328 [Letrouitia transgressa]|nr:MAG: hypothetical protein LQ351_007328 [Letrouitia transgressa]
MPSRKFNEYLDPGISDGSDDSQPGYDSEITQGAADSRTARFSRHISKRQKTHRGSFSSSSSYNNGSEQQAEKSVHKEQSLPKEPTPSIPPQSPTESLSADPPLLDGLSDHDHDSASDKPRPRRKKTHKPGVLYLSRIPPFMRPAAVTHLLAPFGTITKIFLTPEPPASYVARKRAGGNRKRSFVDGWVEFSRRREAKACVEGINGRTAGWGKRGGYYRDDVWNARYLRGFGWDDLMAGVRAEEREREEKVRIGVRRDKKEREEFLRGVERGKAMEGRRRKREGKEKRREEGLGEEESGKKGFEWRFRQNQVRRNGEVREQPEEVKRVLSKIF